MLAQIAISSETTPLYGALGVLASVVLCLWRIGEKRNDRLLVRADKCEEDHKICLDKHTATKEAHAVLANEVGHLRERIKEAGIVVTPALPERAGIDENRNP